MLNDIVAQFRVYTVLYYKNLSYSNIRVALFALGFVTVYHQLMDRYPSDEDRATILKAYIEPLNEDPDQYRHVSSIFHILSLNISEF